MRETIIDLQRSDHERLDSLMQRYAAEPAHARGATFREILRLVTTHAFAEEEVLFPVARRLTARGGPITEEIEARHQRVNELLAELESGSPGDAAFEQRVHELFPLLRQDVRIEEDQLLPALAERLDERKLLRLGKAWLVAKKAAPTRSHPRIPRRPPGNVLAGIPLFFVDRIRDAIARLRPATP